MSYLKIDGGSGMEDNLYFIGQSLLVFVWETEAFHGDVPLHGHDLLQVLRTVLLQFVEKLKPNKSIRKKKTIETDV